MRMSARASRVVLTLAAAAMAAFPSSGARADDGPAKPSANVASTVKPEADEAGGDGDAVTTWLQGTLVRPGHPAAAGQRSQTDGQTVPRRASSGGRDSGSSVAHMLWPLLVVLAVIAGGAVAVRKLFPRANRLGGGGVIDLLASHYLSGRQSLCLVRLGRRAVLLGVTPERIAPVLEISDPEELADVVSAVERGRPNSFSSAFARFCPRDYGGKLAERQAEGRDAVPVDRLTKAGGGVRDLVGRIRSLSEKGESAEPT